MEYWANVQACRGDGRSPSLRREEVAQLAGIGVNTVLFGVLGAIGASAVVARPGHFFTVFGFSPWRAARDLVFSRDAWSSAPTHGFVPAESERPQR